jgi:hypothetical protein
MKTSPHPGLPRAEVTVDASGASFSDSVEPIPATPTLPRPTDPNAPAFADHDLASQSLDSDSNMTTTSPLASPPDFDTQAPHNKKARTTASNPAPPQITARQSSRIQQRVLDPSS